MKKQLLLVGLAVMGLLVAACGTSLNVKTNEQGDTVIEVGLPEAVVNTILKDAVVSGDTENDLLNEITSVDMKPGVITVVGSRNLPDGTKAPGSFDLALATDGGNLSAAVSNVQIQGYTVTDEQLATINQRVADALAKSASENTSSQINSVDITDDSLKFVVTIDNQ